MHPNKSVGLILAVVGCGRPGQWYYVPVGEPVPRADGGSPVAPPSPPGCDVPDGGAMFEAALVAATDPGPWAATVADLNGDGIPDLAVANGGVVFGRAPQVPGRSVTLLYGKGDGSFRPGISVPTEPGTVDLLAGDFSGTGAPQILVSSCDESPDGGGGALQTFAAQPNGTWAGAPPYPLASCPFALASGDFNGDGRLDLAIASPGPFGGGAKTGAVVLLFNHAGSGLQGPIAYPTRAAQWAVAVADVNGDGKPDLLSLGADSTLSVFVNDGKGEFAPLAPLALPPGPWESLAVADFDGDGKPDVAAVSREQSALLVALGRGDGAFNAPSVVPTGGYPVSVVAADFDGDGRPDLTVAYDSGFFDGADLFVNQGKGAFGPAVPLLTAAGGFGAAVGDFNGDGRPDLAVTDNFEGMVSVLLDACAAPPPEADGGAFAEGPHAPIPLVPNNGGPVIASPRLVTVNYPDDPAREHNQAFDAWIAGSQWLAEVGSSYGVGAGALRASAVLPNPAPDKLSDQDIQQMLWDEIDAGVLPAPLLDGGTRDLSDVFMVYLPKKTVVAGPDVGTSCRDFGGYHSEDDIGEVKLVYAVLPTCSDDQDEQDIAASHELAEGATDPFPFTDETFVQIDQTSPWAVLGGEVADLCTSTAAVEDGRWVQRIWSNDAADAGMQPCVPAPEGPFFDVSPEDGGVLHGVAGGTVTVPLQAWSTGPTEPWAIRFLPTWGAFSGRSVFVPEVSFDRAVAGNGQAPVMTVRIPGDAPANGFSAFALYSGHGDGDPNGGYWPFFVYLDRR